jgi:hypothetical protein
MADTIVTKKLKAILVTHPKSAGFEENFEVISVKVE